jgi:carboxyl-terminal processing protease
LVVAPDGTPPPADAVKPVIAVLTPSNIGYLRISNFDSDDIATMVRDAVALIASADGIILDLRQNGGGRMHVALEVCNYFVDNGLLATLKFRHEGGVKTRQYFVNETQFFATEELPDGTKTTEMYERRPALFAGKPIAIIINRRTASAGELMVATLVQNGTMGKVTIVGSGTTPGKGIGQAEYEVLDGAVKVRVTRTHWFAPGGEWLGDCGQTESNGIEPWVLVENDRGPEALKVASDELRKLLDALAGAAA